MVELCPDLWQKLPIECLWPIIKSYLLRPSIAGIINIPETIIHQFEDGSGVNPPIWWKNDGLLQVAWPSNAYFNINLLTTYAEQFHSLEGLQRYFICYREYSTYVVCDIYNWDVTYNTTPVPNIPNHVLFIMTAVKLDTICCTIVITKEMLRQNITTDDVTTLILFQSVWHLPKIDLAPFNNNLLINPVMPNNEHSFAAHNLQPQRLAQDIAQVSRIRPLSLTNQIWAYINIQSLTTPQITLRQYLITHDGVKYNGRKRRSVQNTSMFLQKLAICKKFNIKLYLTSSILAMKTATGDLAMRIKDKN